MNKQTKFITTTGLLIALTIVFQSLSKFVPLGPLSNFTLVLFFSLLQKRKLLRLIIPAIIKTSLLYIFINIVLSVLTLPDAQIKMMLYLFSWPQLVTALIGGMIATPLAGRLKKILNI